jgi:hypothetical protein
MSSGRKDDQTNFAVNDTRFPQTEIAESQTHAARKFQNSGITSLIPLFREHFQTECRQTPGSRQKRILLQFGGGTFRTLQQLRIEIMSTAREKEKQSLRIDRTGLSISDHFEDPEQTCWWHSQSPEVRLQHMMALRAMNYGDRATARLQRVLEIAEFPRR